MIRQPSLTRLWLGLLVLLILIGAVIALILFVVDTGDGSETGAGPPPARQAPVSEDAAIAWEVDRGSGTVSNVVGVDEVTVVSTYGLTEDDRVVAYGEGGDELWAAPAVGAGVYATPDGPDDLVYVNGGNDLTARNASSGEEEWVFDDREINSVEAVGDRLVVESAPVTGCIEEECEFVETTVTVLDAESGEEQAEADGELVAAASSGILVATVDDGLQEDLRLLDLDGDERWSRDLDGDEVERPVAASSGPDAVLTDELVAVSLEGADDAYHVVGFDAADGDEVWEGAEDGVLLSPGPDGTAAVGERDGDAANLVLYDSSGETTSNDLTSIDLGVDDGQARLDPTYVETSGEGYLVFPAAGLVLDEDLEPVATHDAPIGDVTSEGPYLLESDRLTLASWAGDEEFAVDLETPVETDGGDRGDQGIWALDGAIAVVGEDTLAVYR